MDNKFGITFTEVTNAKITDLIKNWQNMVYVLEIWEGVKPEPIIVKDKEIVDSTFVNNNLW